MRLERSTRMHIDRCRSFFQNVGRPLPVRGGGQEEGLHGREGRERQQQRREGLGDEERLTDHGFGGGGRSRCWWWYKVVYICIVWKRWMGFQRRGLLWLDRPGRCIDRIVRVRTKVQVGVQRATRVSKPVVERLPSGFAGVRII